MGSGPLFLFLFFGIVSANRLDPLPDDAVSRGEIDILTWNDTAPGMRSSGLTNHSAKWPNGAVPIYFHSSLSNTDQNDIANAMEEFHKKTCVRFHEAQENDQDFILIVKPPYTRCNSFVGRQGGRQQMNLGPGCYHRGVILHELMHVLGFVHEHNRPDRDDYVVINWKNIKKGEEQNFKKREEDEVTNLDTGYSYDSVMHYERDLFSKNGEATISAKKKVEKVGGSDGLSGIDVVRINRYYDCDMSTIGKEQEEVNGHQLINDGTWNNWQEEQRQRFQQEYRVMQEKAAEFRTEFQQKIKEGWQE